jgi:cell division protein FtsW (lipid II flippase)
VEEAKKVLVLGEAQYNQSQLREAVRWITSHPAKFMKLSSLRFLAFWLPTESATIHYAGTGRRLERVAIYLMTMLSALGLIMLYQRDTRSALVCMSCLAVFPIIHYFVQFQDRYRYPIMWVTFLLGSLPISACVARFVESFIQQVRNIMPMPTTEAAATSAVDAAL